MHSTLPIFQPVSLVSTDPVMVKAFPFATNLKKRRQRDLLVLERGLHKAGQSSSSRLFDLFLHVNPYPSDVDGELRQDWYKVKIATLKNPVGLAHADISKNGYNDVIVIEEPDAGEPLAQVGKLTTRRVSWFENLGPDSGQLKRKEIGKFPGARIVKVGNFTNNFGVQVVIIPETDISDDVVPKPASIVVYTQPLNVTSAPQWLSNVSTLPTIYGISDVHVLPSISRTQGDLDKLLITCKQGVSLLWWASGRWHTRPVSTYSTPAPALVAGGYIEKDFLTYIVSSENLGDDTVLAIHVRAYKKRHNIPLQQASWSRYIIDSFPADTATVLQISCADFDGDSVDEIMVSFASTSTKEPSGGFWYYRPVDLERGKFEKYACILGKYTGFAVDDFRFEGKMDIIALSTPSASDQSPHTLYHFLNDFQVPAIQAYTNPETHNLDLVVRDTSSLSETSCYQMPLYAIAGFEFTLVVLGPGASFLLVSTGKNPLDHHLKVLHGLVHSNVKTVTRKSFRRGKCIPSGGGLSTRPLGIGSNVPVTAGPIGAVFLSIVKAESSTDKIINLIPAPYPLSLQTRSLTWNRERTQWDDVIEVHSFDAFRLLFDKDSSQELVAHVRFTTYTPKAESSSSSSSSPTFIEQEDLSHQISKMCRVRSCIANASECGGIFIVEEREEEASTSTISGLLARKIPTKPKTIFVPSMTEVAPGWRVHRDGNPVVRANPQCDGYFVEYPAMYGWVSDVFQKDGSTYGPHDDAKCPNLGSLPMDVWMDVDFPPFKLEKSDKGKRIVVLLTFFSVVGVFVAVVAFLLARISLDHVRVSLKELFGLLGGWKA